MPQSVLELNRAFDKLESLNKKDFLEARFYHDSSFAFAFMCNNSIYIEQYSYRNHNDETTFPLIKYNSNSSAYKQFKRSFDIQWENSRKTPIQNYEDVGIYPATEKASIKNIYPGDDESRKLLGEKQISIIKKKEKGSINILAFTGKFYFQTNNNYAIREFANKADCNIRFLLIDPVSTQAILRAVADNSRVEDIITKLERCDWQTHKTSNLYMDSIHMRETINSLVSEGYNIELRYTIAPITASLFISDNHIFIEQYLFGRSPKSREIVLGGEYPVFEFDLNGDKANSAEEISILRSSYDVLWENYSRDYSTYDLNLQEKRFDENLAQLKAYFGQKFQKKSLPAKNGTPLPKIH